MTVYRCMICMRTVILNDGDPNASSECSAVYAQAISPSQTVVCPGRFEALPIAALIDGR